MTEKKAVAVQNRKSDEQKLFKSLSILSGTLVC